jgi:hypothetical protein
MSNLTALPAGVAGSGVISWWELRGRLDPGTLVEALEEEGLSDLKPPVTTPAMALQQAVKKLAGARASRTHGIIALKRDTRSWFLVERHLIAEGQDVELAAFARVEVDDNGDYKVVELRPGGAIDFAEAIVAHAKAIGSSSASCSGGRRCSRLRADENQWTAKMPALSGMPGSICSTVAPSSANTAETLARSSSTTGRRGSAGSASSLM